MSLEVADDANTVAVSHDDGSVVFWDLRAAQQPTRFLQDASSSEATKVKFLPNNPQQLLSGGDSGNLCFWDLRMCRLIKTRGYTGTGASSSASKQDVKHDGSKHDEDKHSAKRLKRDILGATLSQSADGNGENGLVPPSPITSLALSNDGK